MHSSRFAAAAAITLLAALAVAPVAAQSGDGQAPTFRSDVRLVLHSIAVLDSDGRPVTDLTRDEFVLYEDGRAVDVQYFLAPDDTFLDVALLLDASTSLSPVAAQVRRAARTFVTRLAPADCVYLLPFNDTAGPGTWGRAADPLLARRIDSIFMEGGTALYDAILEGLRGVDRGLQTGDAAAAAADPARETVEGPPTADTEVTAGTSGPRGDDPTAARERLLAAVDGASMAVAAATPAGSCADSAGSEPAVPGTPERRRALVVLTDGADENSKGRFDEVLDLARAASIPVFPVVVGEARNDPALRQVLDALAGNTGGTVIESLDPGNLESAYDDVVNLLRASYLLGYRAPPGEGSSWREVTVRSRRPSYRVIHRPRYFR